MPVCSGRWTAWKGGKENPHRPTASQMGAIRKEFEKREVLSHSRFNSCKPDAKEKKAPTDQSSTQGQWGAS